MVTILEALGCHMGRAES